MPVLLFVDSLPTPDERGYVVADLFRNIFDFHKLALDYFQKPGRQATETCNESPDH